MPKVTVIIPNYNHGPYLRERINSVINQTLQDIEMIIIDDCSTDNSRDIICQYEHHPHVSFVFYNKVNSGSPYSQWNKALQLANSEWIWVAESDDLADPNFLEKLYPLAIQDEQTSMAYCDSVILAENGHNLQRLYSDLKNTRYNITKWDHFYKQYGITELNEYLKKDCTINNVSAVLFRKSFAREVVKQTGNFRFHGDWMFYILMAEKGKIIYWPEALNQYREHSDNHSKKISGNPFNKLECFHILNYLLKQDYISGKKQLIHHFTREYIGFGLRKENPFSGNSLFKQYRKVNPVLAWRVLLHLLLNKIIPG